MGKLKHNGSILEKIVREDGISIAELTKKLGYKSRGTVYLHFQNADLPAEIIREYAKVLRQDLSVHFPDMFQLDEPTIDYRPKSVAELEGQVDYWKNKYIDLLEKHNAMLLNKIKGS